jgi:hypothetical protein
VKVPDAHLSMAGHSTLIESAIEKLLGSNSEWFQEWTCEVEASYLMIRAYVCLAAA